MLWPVASPIGRGDSEVTGEVSRHNARVANYVDRVDNVAPFTY
jgi:hypothetical protein